MSDFEDSLRRHIRNDGPMNIGAFMNLAVGHYYLGRDPFGREGDFTTAPEVSQMFGEMIGAWVAELWLKLGKPDPFILVECGPGRGTLMDDALRATHRVKGFFKARKPLLVEASPTLRVLQEKVLRGHQGIIWSENLDHPLLHEGAPVIVIGNEFFDALPVRQVQMTDQGWKEKVIALDGDDFVFALAPAPVELVAGLPDAKDGDLYEVAPARASYAENVASLVTAHGGGALFIDYGYDSGKAEKGDTLQAVKGHEYVPVLSDVGEADLTSHVDFTALRHAAEKQGAVVWGSVEQGRFLQNLGIDIRAQMLAANATKTQKIEINTARQRLCGKEQMGELFRVMAFTADKRIIPAGF